MGALVVNKHTVTIPAFYSRQFDNYLHPYFFDTIRVFLPAIINTDGNLEVTITINHKC